MEGRQLAEQVGIAGTQLWDAQMLEAMEAVSSPSSSARSPITKPHLPKRPPTE
jgi:hypothetical protein